MGVCRVLSRCQGRWLDLLRTSSAVFKTHNAVTLCPVAAVRVLVRSMEDQKRPLTGFSIKHRNANAYLVNLMSSSGGRSCTHGGLWHQCCTGCPRRLSGTWHVINSHYDETTWDTVQCNHQVWICVLVLRTEVKHSSHTLGIHFMMFTLNVVRISVSMADDCGDIVCDPFWCLTEQPFRFHVPNEVCFFFIRDMQSCQLSLHFLRHCCSNAPPREGDSSHDLSRVGHLTDRASDYH